MKTQNINKHSIIPILEHYGLVAPQGSGNRWLKVKCCFHDDSHASAAVNSGLNRFNCFACGVKGDTYDIIQEQEGLSFVEAVEFAQRISPESGAGVQPKPAKSRGVPSPKRVDVGRRGKVLDGSGGESTSRTRAIRR
jgi:DNA primase